jgi:hypothetical protein
MGLGVSARANTLNEYLAGVLLGGMIMTSPIALFFFIPNLSLVFPINAAIDLLITKTELQTVKGVIADTAVLVCWNIIGYIFAKSQFSKYIIHK